MHLYTPCSFCGGAVKEKRVDLDYRYQGKLFIFENVPAGVCRQCGEKYLTAPVAHELEKRMASGQKWERTVSIPVEAWL